MREQPRGEGKTGRAHSSWLPCPRGPAQGWVKRRSLDPLGCRRLSAWASQRRLSPTLLGAEAGEGLGTDIQESGGEL